MNSGREHAEDPAISAAFAAANTREEANRLEIDANPVGFAHIVSAFARAPSGGIVIHCHGGKDRTGIAVALRLAAVGVPDHAIAADYVLSLEGMDSSDKPPSRETAAGNSRWRS